MLGVIEGRQAKRKGHRRDYDRLKEEIPNIDLDDTEWKNKLGKSRKEHQKECQGVDADIDWIKAAAKLAVRDVFKLEGKTDPSFKEVDERLDAYGREARPHLSAETQTVLDREADRAAAQEKEAQKERDKEIEEDAERRQTLIPGTEEAVKANREAAKKSKGKKAGKLTVTTDPFFQSDYQEQVAREDTFIPPAEEALADVMDAFKDEPETVEKLPPADGFKPEDKETEGKKPKKASTKKTAAKPNKKKK